MFVDTLKNSVTTQKHTLHFLCKAIAYLQQASSPKVQRKGIHRKDILVIYTRCNQCMARDSFRRFIQSKDAAQWLEERSIEHNHSWVKAKFIVWYE